MAIETIQNGTQKQRKISSVNCQGSGAGNRKNIWINNGYTFCKYVEYYKHISKRHKIIHHQTHKFMYHSETAQSQW